MAIELEDALSIAIGTAVTNLLLEGLLLFSGVHEFFLQIAPLTYSVTRILIAGMLAVIGIEAIQDRNIVSDGSYLYLLGYFTILSSLVYGVVSKILGIKLTVGVQGVSITFDTFVAFLIVASGTLASHYSEMGVKKYIADLKIINYSALLMMIPFLVAEFTGVAVFNLIGVVLAIIITGILVVDFASGGRIADSDYIHL